MINLITILKITFCNWRNEICTFSFLIYRFHVKNIKELEPRTESTEQELCISVHLQLRHEREEKVDVGDQHDDVHDELPEEEGGEGSLQL